MRAIGEIPAAWLLLARIWRRLGPVACGCGRLPLHAGRRPEQQSLRHAPVGAKQQSRSARRRRGLTDVVSRNLVMFSRRGSPSRTATASVTVCCGRGGRTDLRLGGRRQSLRRPLPLITAPSHVLTGAGVLMMVAGPAVYLAGEGLVRLRMVGRYSRWRVLTILSLAILGIAGSDLPALALATGVAAILVALAAVEYAPKAVAA